MARESPSKRLARRKRGTPPVTRSEVRILTLPSFPSTVGKVERRPPLKPIGRASGTKAQDDQEDAAWGCLPFVGSRYRWCMVVFRDSLCVHATGPIVLLVCRLGRCRSYADYTRHRGGLTATRVGEAGGDLRDQRSGNPTERLRGQEIERAVHVVRCDHLQVR